MAPPPPPRWDWNLHAVPSVVKQGSPGPCTTFDHETVFSISATVPTSFSFSLNATSSDPRIVVDQRPRSTSRTGDVVVSRFGFSCNERGVTGTATVTESTGWFQPATVEIKCLKAVILHAADWRDLSRGVHVGEQRDATLSGDPRAPANLPIKSEIELGAGILQVTPQVRLFEHHNHPSFNVTCLAVGDGRAAFAVSDPATAHEWQELRCPIRCLGD